MLGRPAEDYLDTQRAAHLQRMRELTELRETTTRDAQQLRETAQHEADETLGHARREADETLRIAQMQARELARNAETIWRERRRLLDDMRAVGDQLTAIGDTEAKRFARAPDDISAREQAPAPRNANMTEPTEPQEAIET